jgi:TolA-binding protein
VKYPLSDVAPEATYWAAVSRYKDSHEAEDLLGGWRKLQSRYPESAWRVRQAFTER